MSHGDIAEIIKGHLRYVTGRPGGKCANLSSRDVSGINFSGLNLKSIIAPGSIFSRCALVETDLSFSDLFGANFEKTDCSKANFHRADIRGARFHGAKLTDANFDRTIPARVPSGLPPGGLLR